MTGDGSDPLGVVDVHVHFWQRSQPWHPSVASGEPPPGGDGLPDAGDFVLADYVASASSGTLEPVKIVHVGTAFDPSHRRAETAWLDEVAASSRIPIAIVPMIDLAAEPNDVAAELETYAAYGGFRGIRPSTRVDYESPSTVLAFEFLARTRAVYDFVSRPTGMARVLAAARRYADVPFALEHFGWPKSTSADDVDAWKRGMKELAQAPNVVCKFSGANMFLERLTPDALLPFVAHALDVFGPERCMIGTNSPVDTVEISVGQVFDAFRACLERLLDRAELPKVLAGTAERVYRL